MEYAIELLETPILMVLGHERCGAVTAAVKNSPLPGQISTFVEAILPAIRTGTDPLVPRVQPHRLAIHCPNDRTSPDIDRSHFGRTNRNRSDLRHALSAEWHMDHYRIVSIVVTSLLLQTRILRGFLGEGHRHFSSDLVVATRGICQ